MLRWHARPKIVATDWEVGSGSSPAGSISWVLASSSHGQQSNTQVRSALYRVARVTASPLNDSTASTAM